MAESELSVLSSQCLDRRIGDLATLRDEVAAWVAARNKHQAKADWQFTADDARAQTQIPLPNLPRSKSLNWPTSCFSRSCTASNRPVSSMASCSPLWTSPL